LKRIFVVLAAVAVVVATAAVPAMAQNADKAANRATNKAAKQAQSRHRKRQRPGAQARTSRLLAGACRKRCRVAAACPLAISLSWAPAPYSWAAEFCSTRRVPFRRKSR
jgi:Ni/Co efflux regulator RcnB